jgi:DNA-binding NarL/FixJ family response regulator
MQTNPVKPIRVILADDHPIVRAGIRETLNQIPRVEIVGEASDGREAVELVKAARPDLVLMDISMPGLNGLEATERMVKAFPELRVIILSRHENEDYYWRALRLGACGYVLKKAVITELKAAVERVARGEIYLSEEISTRLRKQLPLQQIAQARSPVEKLSGRQREILQLIAEGQTTKAIALTLKLSPKTVEYHRTKLMQTLHIFDVPGLVRFAMRTGLISHES